MANCIVSIADKTVRINISNSTDIAIIGILGKEFDDKGMVNVLYLDALIHNGNTFEGWKASGAVSTVLTKISNNRGGAK